MKVQLDSGEVIDLGVTEAAPTIGMVDYSRRETDAFGVTTVVPRDFARRMSLRFALPTAEADALQRRLAGVRATPAQWIADERFAWLNFRGFYKSFDIDLAVPPLSYCSLDVEGLAGSEAVEDPGGDPAPAGATSSLQLLNPVAIGDSALVASSVPEADHAEWSTALSYPLGARVIKAATHRIYESASDANQGNDPAGASGRWLDVGPTNRWAMFDEALGSITTSAAAIVVTLQAGTVNALALLDVSGTSVRVQAAGIDRTVAPSAGGSALFLDLPVISGEITVTIDGPGTKSVGTLLVGTLLGLGVTEADPSAGITDYSQKVVDAFGVVTVVERSWAKRMAAKALITTEALDVMANRIAAVRARPALWIADDDLDSLKVYGFFKDFSIEVGEAVSKLSLSIQGLSTAGEVKPLGAIVEWPDIADPTGTKPQDNADVTGENTAKDTAAVGGVPADEVNARIEAARAAIDDIDTLTQRIIEDADVLEGRVTSLRASISSNLIGNSELASKAGFRLFENVPGKHAWVIDGGDFKLVDEHHFGLLGLERNGDHTGVIISDWVPVLPGDWVQVSAWIASRECVNRIVLDWGNAAGVMITSAAAESELVGDEAYGGPALDAFTRVWCKAQVPDNGARLARLALAKGPFLENVRNDLSWAFMLRPMIARTEEEPSEPAAYMPRGGGAALTETAIVAASAQASAAQVKSILKADTLGQNASLTELRQVAADTIAGVSGSLWRQVAVGGNARAQMSLYAIDDNGQVRSGVDIIGDLTLSGNLIVNGSIIKNKVAQNQLTQSPVSGGGADYTSLGQWITVAQLTVGLDPFERLIILLSATCNANAFRGPGDPADFNVGINVYYRLLHNGVEIRSGVAATGSSSTAGESASTPNGSVSVIAAADQGTFALQFMTERYGSTGSVQTAVSGQINALKMW